MEYKEFYRRNLPHIQPKDSVLFVSYRLYFELPGDFIFSLNKMKAEFRRKTSSLSIKEREMEKYKFEIELFEFEDNYLGKFRNSPLWLMNPQIAEVVKDSLFWIQKKYYDLFAFCIMPNHVHLVIRPNEKNDKPFPLQKIMYDHKHFTALEANKVLNRKGRFWQEEHYDHYIRDDKDFYRIMNYIYQNPVLADLVDEPEEWKYTYINEELC